jgi:hypothetical protein
MKPGAPTRLMIGIFLGIVLALMLLAEAWIASHRGASLSTVIALWGLFIVVIIATLLLLRRWGTGTVRITREGLFIPVGLRPLFLEWEALSEIKEITFRGKAYVGIRLKSLETQRKAIQYLAKMNDEHTGSHLVLGEGFFDRPLASMASLIAGYAGDETAREGLPSRNQEP